MRIAFSFQYTSIMGKKKITEYPAWLLIGQGHGIYQFPNYIAVYQSSPMVQDRNSVNNVGHFLLITTYVPFQELMVPVHRHFPMASCSFYARIGLGHEKPQETTGWDISIVLVAQTFFNKAPGGVLCTETDKGARSIFLGVKFLAKSIFLGLWLFLVFFQGLCKFWYFLGSLQVLVFSQLEKPSIFLGVKITCQVFFQVG